VGPAVTVHLRCSCGAESWSWSALEVDPIALAFTADHLGRGHHLRQLKQLKNRPQVERESNAPRSKAKR
jgi:hypothetical protein